MKLSKLFLIGAIALGMVACNNNDVPEVVNGPDATVSVKVFPSSKSPQARLAGDLSGDGITATGLAEESAIKNVEVWLFAGEAPNGYKKGNDGEAFVEGVETSAGAKVMVVAANANIGAVANKTALLNQLKELSQLNIEDAGLVMTSEPVDVTLVGGHNQYGFKTDDTNYDGDAEQHSLGARLPITRINARVALVGLTYEFDSPFFDRFELTEVTMFNARKSSKLFGTSLVNGTEFLFGSDYASSLGSYVGSDAYTGAFSGADDVNLLQEFVSNPALNKPNLVNPVNAHYFYVFENTANTTENSEGTFIVLKGKLFNGVEQYIAPGLDTDADGFTYYAIWVNDPQWNYNEEHTADGTIKRNTQYNIIAKLTKAGNPTIDPAEEAQLDVYVEVAPWIVVTQNVDW